MAYHRQNSENQLGEFSETAASDLRPRPSRRVHPNHAALPAGDQKQKVPAV